MSRLTFDSQGRLAGIDAGPVKYKENFSWKKEKRNFNEIEEEDNFSSGELKKTEERVWKKLNNTQEREYWSLYKDGKRLEPLKFSNGKTQEDIVKEIVELIKGGTKLIFLKGMCGTGKSSIALNIARSCKAAVVVPVKSLQSQYEEDYMKKMYLIKSNGEELRISMITGRNNHDSLIKPGVSCADPSLPENIQIIEKNFKQVREYYMGNPLIKHKELDNIKQFKRISIAPANPYWSPIIPAEYNIQIGNAEKKKYMGLRNREFTFHHRKKGCSYYDQYQSYIDSDVIIFNSAKYKIEVALDRKPETDVDIIDEADEFLDSFSSKMELNLTRLSNSLKNALFDDYDVRAIIDSIVELISLEEKNKRAIGIDENKIFHIKETNLGKILQSFTKNKNVESEISLDELNYANKGVEVAKQFVDFLEDTYITYKKYEDNLYANLVTTDLSKRLGEILDKNKAFVFMSGTLHSEEVLKNIFGINDYKIVEAETSPQGEIDIQKTGKEF
ncbi:MAG: DEAD/DEAH box helicase family protein, partial [Nanoarchaeota archaeon]